MKKFFLSPLVTAVGLLLAGQQAQAASYAWNCTSGNWSLSTCWSPNGVPGTSSLDYAYISATASDTSLTFDASTGNRTVAYLGMGMNTTTGMATVNQTGSNLVVTGSQTIGYRGAATYNQSAGSNQTYALYVGAESTSVGIYALNGGATTQTASVHIGQSGTGTFNNVNGAHAANALILGGLASGNGTYAIRNTASTTVSNIYIGQAGSGAFNQSGGSVNVSGNVLLGSSGGSGALNISGGYFNTANFSAGASEGGSGNVTLSLGTLNTTTAVLADGINSQGTATVSGGRWDASGLQVGGQGAGTVTQLGGTVNITGALVLGNSSGSSGAYSVSGPGVLQAASIVVGRSGSGSFTQGANTNVLISGSLVIAEGDNSTGIYTLNGGNLATGGIINNGSLVQTAGAMSGSLTNNGSFSYSGGYVGGRVVNNGGLGLNADASFLGGIENNTNVYVSSARTLTLGGVTSVNNGTVSMAGGRIDQSGGLSNEGVVSGYGSLSGSGGFINNSLVQILSGNLALSTTGSNINAGTIALSAGRQLQLASGTALSNAGSIELASGQVSGAGQLTNTAGGSVTGKGTIAARFANAGYLGVGSGTTGITQAFTNSGLIDLSAGSSNLIGGAISNIGTVQGQGNVANAVSNLKGGTIEAIGGTLNLTSASNVNGGTLVAGVGAKLLFTNGLAVNEGQVQLSGGTFDNGGKALTNAKGASITGNGTLRTGGLTNDGALNLSFGNSTISGEINSTESGTVVVSNGAQVTFANDFRNNGELRVSDGGAVNFFGNVSGGGKFGGDGQSRFEGGFTPGNSPALISVGFKATYAGSSWIEMELGGTEPGNCLSCSDKIIFNNSVALKGGDLRVVWWNNFNGQAGNVFDLFDWNGPLVGTFGNVWLPTLGQGLRWDTSGLYTTGELRVAAVPEPHGWVLMGAALAVLGLVKRRQGER